MKTDPPEQNTIYIEDDLGTRKRPSQILVHNRGNAHVFTYGDADPNDRADAHRNALEYADQLVVQGKFSGWPANIVDLVKHPEKAPKPQAPVSRGRKP